MRSKKDINMNQCEKCGKIVKDGELSCPPDNDNSGKWEGLALCNDCINKLEELIHV